MPNYPKFRHSIPSRKKRQKKSIGGARGDPTGEINANRAVKEQEKKKILPRGGGERARIEKVEHSRARSQKIKALDNESLPSRENRKI